MRLSTAIREGLKTPGITQGHRAFLRRKDCGSYQACALGFGLIGALGIDEVLRLASNENNNTLAWDIRLGELILYTFPSVPTKVIMLATTLNDDRNLSVREIAKRLADMGY